MELWTIGNGTLDWTVNNGITMNEEDCSTPRSPGTPKSVSSNDVKRASGKDEAIADAHRTRVAQEATAFLDAEVHKAEAHAQKMHAKADKYRLDEEAKAVETLRKEEFRAGLLVHNTELKVEKLLAQSKARAASIGAAAEEQYAKTSGDAKTKAERSNAEIEETKQREIAELRDKVEQMILMEELPSAVEHKGVVQKVKDEFVHKVKDRVFCHLRGH